MITDEQRNVLPAGRYRHFKGMEYEVLGTAVQSETREEMVVYRALYGGYGLFVRPAGMFAEEVTRDGLTQPRFSYLGPSAVRKLSLEAQSLARSFMLEVARPLEGAWYLREFEGGSADAVYAALAIYQNPDGGFGHGLEPDLNTPASSALATTSALQSLRLLRASADNPLVVGAIGWLNRAFDADNTRWPLIPSGANDAPHAPWWTEGPDHPSWFRQYAVNPRAEILGHLYSYPTLADAQIVNTVETALIAHYRQNTQPLDMHEVLCTLRLLESPDVPETLRIPALAAVVSTLDATLARDAAAWESYSLHPLQVAPAPDSPFAPLVADVVAADLDFRISGMQR